MRGEWRDGIHQAVGAKEGLNHRCHRPGARNHRTRFSCGSNTLGEIDTAWASKTELRKIYRCHAGSDEPPKTNQTQYTGLSCRKGKMAYGRQRNSGTPSMGRAVLIGTRTIDSQKFFRASFKGWDRAPNTQRQPHRSEAGRGRRRPVGQVTVSTNMAELEPIFAFRKKFSKLGDST